MKEGRRQKLSVVERILKGIEVYAHFSGVYYRYTQLQKLGIPISVGMSVFSNADNPRSAYKKAKKYIKKKHRSRLKRLIKDIASMQTLKIDTHGIEFIETSR